MTESEFLAELSRFFSEKREEETLIRDNTDLLAEGLVDSLIMVELVMRIEEITGRPVDPDLLEPALFERASLLHETFFNNCES